MPWQVSAAKLCGPSVYKFRSCLESGWQRPHVIWRKSLFLKWNKNKIAVRVVAAVYLSHFRGITYIISSLFPIESGQKNLCWQNKCILIPYHFWRMWSLLVTFVYISKQISSGNCSHISQIQLSSVLIVPNIYIPAQIWKSLTFNTLYIYLLSGCFTHPQKDNLSDRGALVLKMSSSFSAETTTICFICAVYANDMS